MSSEEEKKRPSARRPRARAASDRPPVEIPKENGERPKKEERSAEPRPSARRAKKKTPLVRAEPEATLDARLDAEVKTFEDPPEGSSDAIYDLEERVDRLITEADSIAGDPQARRRAAEALSELAARLGGYENEAPQSDESGFRELLRPDYYVRQWGRIAMRNRSEHVDDFGLDATYESRFAPVFTAMYRNWFRAAVLGVEHVPAEGRAMIVANHGGALPWDGLMLRTAVRLEHPAQRTPRWLAEDFVYHMPFLGSFVSRVGAVRACPENAERLLDRGELLAVFPEGMKGVGKLYRRRYELQRFGRGGYIKLALRTGAPIVPAGIVGAEEAYPLLLESNRAAQMLGLPFLPITPLFPWLGPFGLVPLPSRWAIVFGDPIDLSSHGPDAAQDALLVNRLNDEVRSKVQELVQKALSTREGAY